MPRQRAELEKITVVEEIEDKILFLRGQRVMLDSDLAEVYGIETKRLKEQVRRNLSRFPKDFMFGLTADEVQQLDSSRSQFATLKVGKSRRGTNTKYPPFAFTEHGAVMLASVLNSPTAVEASIVVVRAFVKMRSILALHQDLADRVAELEKVTDHHDEKFGVVSHLLSEILHDPKYLKRNIGFVEPKKLRSGNTTISKKTKGK